MMSEEYEKRSQSGLSNILLLKTMLLIMAPILVPTLLLDILFYTFRLSVEATLSGAVVSGALCFVAAYGYYNKTANELHGKKGFILTFREKGAITWQDWLVIKSQEPITQPKLQQLLIEELNVPIKSNPEEYPKLPYKIEFEDNASGLTQMILISPCPIDQLGEFTPQPILYKGLILNASACLLDVTKVRELSLEGLSIPIVIPTGSDFIAEHIQHAAKFFDVKKEELDDVMAKFDAYESVKLKQELVTKTAEIGSLLEALKDFDKAVDERANAKVRAYLKTRKTAHVIPSFLKVKKFWIILGLAVILMLILILI
jgi:hypothetical protein